MSSSKLKNLLLELYQNGIDELNKNNLDEAERYLLLVYNKKKECYINKLYFNLGVLKYKKNIYNEAYEYFKKSIEINENVLKCYFIISTQFGNNNIDESLLYLSRLEDLYNKNINIFNDLSFDILDVYVSFGIHYESIGNYNKANEYLFKTLKLDKNKINALEILSMYNNVTKNEEYSKLIQYYKINLNDILKNINSSIDVGRLYFCLAKSEVELKNYKLSFEYYRKGNTYNTKQFYSMYKKLPDYKNIKNILLKNNFIIDTNSPKKDYPKVIFIIGIPRSGSTLVESILGCIDNSKTLGESNAIFEVVKLKNLDVYFKNLMNFSYLIDKNLSNFEQIPLLIKYFPGCKIINMNRNCLDNILSMYTTNIEFYSRYNSADLEDILKYYLYWKDLTNTWKDMYPGHIYDCYYDKIVNEPKKYISELVEYLELNWSDEFLNFYKNKRNAYTSSSYQVKQPIYKTSSNKWHNYKEELKHIIKLLDENGIEY